MGGCIVCSGSWIKKWAWSKYEREQTFTEEHTTNWGEERETYEEESITWWEIKRDEAKFEALKGLCITFAYCVYW